MYDSIFPDNLPPGGAYLGYVNGNWPTFPILVKRFPGAHLLDMTVFAAGDATGCDCETGDLSPAQVPGWVARQLARGVHRPVVYASAGVMPGVMALLEGAGITREQVRLLSAHYSGEHICGPATCRASDGAGRIVPACDGTQWSDSAPGVNGTTVDISVLADGFFDTPPPPPAPAPEPVPVSKKGAPPMILIEVARNEVPAGTTWPGVFLLASDGTLHHVTATEGGISNVAAYQAAGIPGPVTISWAEYQARIASPA